jgi:hypothetical protein
LNEGMNDSAVPSNSKPSDKSADIEKLSAVFHEEAEFPFKVSDKQKPILAALIQKHGVAAMVESVKICANESNHTWEMVGCPASIYLQGAETYIRLATENLEYEKRQAFRSAGIAQ